MAADEQKRLNDEAAEANDLALAEVLENCEPPPAECVDESTLAAEAAL